MERWFGRFGRILVNQRSPRRSTSSSRLRFEQLEDRSMPSLTVSLPDLLEFREGEFVYVYPNVNHTPECSSRSLTFSATGLPDGLSLDPHTGLISGVPPHGLANRTFSTRDYTITLTATDGLDTVSASTTLHIY
ncbi:MAG: Ig domain-containing protein, partial [Gemmatales bacterium]|nr:Ig domain-containing protein [Gemmatales bacterium]